MTGLIVPPHLYDKLHADDPEVKRRETDRLIAQMINQAATPVPQQRPNRAARRRRRR